MKRAWVVAAWLLGGVAFGLPPAISSAQPTGKLEQVKVAFSNPGMPIFPVSLAQEIGFFREQQLAIRMVMMSSALAGKALVAGDLDYSTMAGTLIALAAVGAPIKIVFVATNRPIFMFIGRPGIKGVKDLKGKAIAIGSHGSMDDTIARKVVASAGLNPEKDVQMLSLGGTSTRLSALRAGSVDATMLTVPFNLELERLGYTRLAFAGDVMQPVMNGLGVSDQKLKERPDQIKRMIRVMLKAQAYMRSHREEAIQKAMAWYKFDRQGAELAYDLAVQSMPAGDLPPDESFKVVIESSRGRQALSGEVPISQVADLSLLKEVLKEMKP